jgi:hypothetical protein
MDMERQLYNQMHEVPRYFIPSHTLLKNPLHFAGDGNEEVLKQLSPSAEGATLEGSSFPGLALLGVVAVVVVVAAARFVLVQEGLMPTQSG